MIIYTWDIDLKLFEFLKNIFNKTKNMNTIFITVKQTNMYHNWYMSQAHVSAQE